MIAALLVFPPDRILTLVRAIAPVAGWPPKIDATIVASPCPKSSLLGWNFSFE